MKCIKCNERKQRIDRICYKCHAIDYCQCDCHSKYPYQNCFCILCPDKGGLRKIILTYDELAGIISKKLNKFIQELNPSLKEKIMKEILELDSKYFPITLTKG